MLDTHGRKYVQPLFNKAADGLIKLKLSPIHVTLIAFLIGLVSNVVLYLGYYLVAVLLLWLSGLFDVLDGTIARKTGQSSDLGAFLDITFDRMVEIGIIIALALSDPSLSTMLVFLASSIVITMTIFLTVGNFAENRGKKSFYYQAGVAERTEGFIFFSLMILIPTYRTEIGYVFAAVILFTALQRFIEGIKILKD